MLPLFVNFFRQNNLLSRCFIMSLDFTFVFKCTTFMSRICKHWFSPKWSPKKEIPFHRTLDYLLLIALLLKWEYAMHLLFVPTWLFSMDWKERAIRLVGYWGTHALTVHVRATMTWSRKAGLNNDPWHWYLDKVIAFYLFFLLGIFTKI